MMPVLISRIARCSGVASLCSTIAATLPSAPRTILPYPEGSSSSTVSSERMPCCARSATCRKVSARASGSAPNITSVTPSAPNSDSAHFNASPVPRGGSCRAHVRSASAKRSRTSPPESTTQMARGSSLRAVESTCASNGLPPSGCSTLGSAERMRFPCPAARMAICSDDCIRHELSHFARRAGIRRRNNATRVARPVRYMRK